MQTAFICNSNENVIHYPSKVFHSENVNKIEIKRDFHVQKRFGKFEAPLAVTRTQLICTSASLGSNSNVV